MVLASAPRGARTLAGAVRVRCDAAMIVPRWEWRTFQAPFGEAEHVLAGLTPDREEYSDERYLLSLNSDASIKVRDQLVDVKRRLAVDEHGLEQWLPVLKSAWPLDGDATREV